MKDKRLGESLWNQWTGEGYYAQSVIYELLYFTEGHVDTENEIVRRALASTLQRDGIADSLSDGFQLIADAHFEAGWAGILEGENDYTFCDESGETEYGDYVEEVIEITWVEI